VGSNLTSWAAASPAALVLAGGMASRKDAKAQRKAVETFAQPALYFGRSMIAAGKLRPPQFMSSVAIVRNSPANAAGIAALDRRGRWRSPGRPDPELQCLQQSKARSAERVGRVGACNAATHSTPLV
jgi:hypothetical protein